MRNLINKIRKQDEKQVKVMQWPTKEDTDKGWGTSGYDRHYVK